MSEEKVYVGNAKKITTQYGELIKLSITAEDLEKMQQNLNNGWINILVKERRSPSPSGLTHYLEVDTWKPEARMGEDNTAPAPEVEKNQDITPEDLPF